jgi:predicted transposase/invertase (TIGR01784 family)
MTELEHKFTKDTVFKMLFFKHQELLRNLVATLLKIPLESIEEFAVANSELPPGSMDEKFCHIDINMMLDSQKVHLEIQVANKGDYPERTLYYWAREYTSALGEGMDYKDLPRTVHVSIIGFRLFDCDGFHSEFRPLEVERHEVLTDRMSMHYFELPKVPEGIDPGDELRLWLSLFKAETEEELELIEATGVPTMEQAIQAYRGITATQEFKELERIRILTKSNEASALRHAREQGIEQGVANEREKWQGVVAEKDDLVAEQAKMIANKDEMITKLQAQLAERK